MAIWKLRCGDTRHGRDYEHVCLSTGLALLGTDWLDQQLRGAVPPDNLEELRGNARDSQVRFIRALDNMAPDDIVALVYGNSCRAIGKVRDVPPLSMAEAMGVKLFDIDGWCLPIARAVDWRKPPGQLRDLQFSTDRCSRVQNPAVRDCIEGWHAEAFGGEGGWMPGIAWEHFGAAAAVPVEDVGRVPEEILACANYYRNGNLGQHEPREHEVVTHLVVPFLQHLGWTRPMQIEIEGGNIDLVLYADENRQQPRVLVEAKRVWGSTTGSLEQVHQYYIDYPEQLRAQVTAIATTTGTRWAVWTTDDQPRLRAYCDLASPEHPAWHPLLQALAAPGESVLGLGQVIELLSP